jgi:parvulin-like peptidyl-prolyl isomerase
MIDGEPVMWDAVRAGLGEAAGNEILNELALESRLRKRMAREGLVLEPAMVERERDMFAEAAASAGVSGEDAAAALERVRRQRGLGPTRFASMLRRSAMLRALVQPQVKVNEASVTQAYALRYGERFRARVITVATAREASDAVARVRGGEDFSRVAAEVSTDTSAARGGVIDPVSPADPSYPQALRDTLAKMTIGQVSDPIALGDGFTVLMLDGRGAAGGAPPTLETVRAEMERDARRRQERLLMEQLAREIASGADVRPLDGSLRWSVEGGR